MPEVSQLDVLVYIFEHQPVSATEIIKEFVGDKEYEPKSRIARGTLFNWLRNLCSSGEITRKYDETRKKGRTYAYYSIGSEYHDEIEKEFLKRKLINFNQRKLQMYQNMCMIKYI